MNATGNAAPAPGSPGGAGNDAPAAPGPGGLTAFVPMTRREMRARGWDAIDILIVSGDAYVDHPTFGTAVIARVLLDAGFRVGIAAQPDWRDPRSLMRLGRPRLGCGVSAGNMDSMVKLYTAGRRLRRRDAYSPGGRPGLCPPHASVVYAQLARRAFPGLPVVLGGVEASLRRVAHYDYWQDKMRPSMLVDSKADILCYGMGELTILDIFRRIERGEPLSGIPGTCRYLGGRESDAFPPGAPCVELPSFEEIVSDRLAIMRQTKLIEREMNPLNARRLTQRTRGRILLVEPPRPAMSPEQFDRVCELPYAGVPHWTYREPVPAWETIKDSVPVVRGCPGGCAFCGLAAHQGRQMVSRTPESVERSVRRLAARPFFRGTVSDVGGPAGNTYGHRPRDPRLCAACRRFSCLFPDPCPNYLADGRPLSGLLDRLSRIPGVRHLYINSGLRLDLALMQPALTEKIIRDHVSGQVSVAPEHLDGRVLSLMRKGKPGEFERFKALFDRVSREAGKKQFITPYFISNFPGDTEEGMRKVHGYLARLRWSPRQVQDFIPLAMTMGAAMYCSGVAPDGTPLPVRRGLAERRPLRNLLRPHPAGGHGVPPPQ